MSSVRSTQERVKKCIIRALELEITEADIDNEAILFAPAGAGGLDLDSLAALEIVVAIGKEFNLLLSEVPEEAFISVNTLSSYIDEQLNNNAG